MSQSTLWRIKAPLYSAWRRLPVVRRVLQVEMHSLRALLQSLPAIPERHLDLGTGTGDTLEIFGKNSKRVHLDISTAMLEKVGLSPKMRAYAEHLPFVDRSFGIVSAIGLSEYLENLELMLDEVARVLEPSGYFLLTSSPTTMANHLRRALGHRLFLRSNDNVRDKFQQSGWIIIAESHSWLQAQWLLQKGHL